MVFGDTQTGVAIADGRCGVRFTRLGDAGALGYPAEIEVRAGPFSGVFADDGLAVWPRFVAEMETLYSALRGEAELTSYFGFRLRMVGDGRGGVGVDVQAFASHAPRILLTFEFAIDQTYLPGIIQAFRREFPAPVANPKSAP